MTLPDEDLIMRYVDRRVSADEAAAVEQAARDDLDFAERLALDIRVREALRAMDSEPAGMSAPPPSRAVWRPALIAASLVLAGSLGWTARQLTLPEPPMGDAVQAFSEFATLPAGGSLSASEAHSAPDLSDLGFSLIDVRGVDTPEGPARLAGYQSADRRSLIIYTRPAHRPRLQQAGLRRDDEVETRYWFEGGRGFAVTGNAPAAALAAVEARVRTSLTGF